jgi:hypothetical protein
VGKLDWGGRDSGYARLEREVVGTVGVRLGREGQWISQTGAGRDS